MEVAFLARESHLLALDGVVIIPRMTPAKASEGAGSNPPQAASINPAVDSAASTTTAGTTASQSAPPAVRAKEKAWEQRQITAADRISASDRY